MHTIHSFAASSVVAQYEDPDVIILCGALLEPTRMTPAG
jgi:hypothetical protein